MRIKRALNKKGLTMMELIVGILVLTIILVAVTSIFAPMLRAYQRANNLAEANTILDNLAAFILDDIARAGEILPLDDRILGNGDVTPPIPPPVITPELTISSSALTVIFDVAIEPESGRQILWREDVGRLYRSPVLAPEFYRNTHLDIGWTVDRTYCLVTITLRLYSDDGWQRERTYAIRPLALTPPSPSPP